MFPDRNMIMNMSSTSLPSKVLIKARRHLVRFTTM